MDRMELKQVILENSTLTDDRYYLTCGAAHEIAEKLGISLGEIGKICNEDNIKIKACQLGCF